MVIIIVIVIIIVVMAVTVEIRVEVEAKVIEGIPCSMHIIVKKGDRVPLRVHQKSLGEDLNPHCPPSQLHPQDEI